MLDVLGTLVRLSEADRPSGIQAEVLRAVQNMIVLLDEQFLVHSAVHRAVLRLLRTCVGDDLQEQLDGRNKAMGAEGSLMKTPPSEHEEDCTCQFHLRWFVSDFRALQLQWSIFSVSCVAGFSPIANCS